MSREREIKILLADYMNFLPPGPQEAFVPTGAATGGMIESDWPITPELEKRMDRTTLVGETYGYLDDALRALNETEPDLYNAIYHMYLQEESGHRDEDKIILNSATSEGAKWFLFKLDKALEWLAEYLQDKELYVRWPQKAAGPKPGQNMKERHDELFAIFGRYYDGSNYKDARDAAVFKTVDHEGNPYYTNRHADRIIKPRLHETEK